MFKEKSPPTSPAFLSRKILDAVAFAAHKHTKQRRKDKEQTPYINHPIGVAHLLSELGDEEIIIAAILHDVLEDTNTTEHQIQFLFGENVLGIVKEVTDDKSLTSDVRKRLQIEHAPHLSYGAKLVKIADKICNLSDMVKSPPDGWPMERIAQYADWSEAVIAGLGPIDPGLEFLAQGTLSELRSSLKAETTKA
ncbi:HD domain-containing protein [Polynucleobacter sp. JS-Safj-400b-B2]|uniref:HD domain-containing protein n=1 Tax=Polynucleobacter sp. JS-Safj-400b-B2 TaxID=2576921 RepID=UPI001C0CDB89|nr:HD domain-containing protein [Polynucleobacter sp. JS-Safj-400b-B2]MBU3625922.1 HD domain-containing protein [Polynucleobacter sp. JS-Safj-400b-B2]